MSAVSADAAPRPVRARRQVRAPLLRAGRSLAQLIASLVVIIGVWLLVLSVFHISPFIGKRPQDVWQYLITATDASAHRGTILGETGTTLKDALLGLVSGTTAAVGAAMVFHLWRTAERAIMPVAMVLRSVPVVAVTPLIVLLFGRNVTAVMVIAGIVTFFPTLVNVAIAMRTTPQGRLDLMSAYGASRAATLWKVQIPTALPALFTSLRIASPLALVGALLAEWLATGAGLGNAIIQSAAESNYDDLWAQVAVITLASILLYKIVEAVEALVMTRYGPVRR